MIYHRCAILFLRPYISRELPGWGRLCHWFLGDYRSDPSWAEPHRRWMRGKLHGYEMLLDLGQWSNRMTFFLGRLYDLPTQLLMKAILRANDTFVDVGANEGALSLLASRLVGGGRVIAFEPNPQARAILEAAIQRNRISNISIHPVGLGAANSSLSLTVPRINSGEATFGRSNYSGDDVIVLDCPVRRGDELLSDVRPALIKVDVEGFELSVIKGLADTISRFQPPIVMEMIAGHLANADTRPSDIADFLAKLGYSPFTIDLKKVRLHHELDIRPTAISSDIDGDILWLHSDNDFRHWVGGD